MYTARLSVHPEEFCRNGGVALDARPTLVNGAYSSK